MEFNLNLTIRGLCAFVPLAPLVYGERQQISRVKVLVLDARTPRTITERTEEPLEICGHIPELRLPDDPDWPLTDHRIEIDGLDNELPLLIEPSFGRLAQMEKAAPGSQLVQDRFLANDPPVGLVANLDLITGTVETLAPKLTNWVFRPELVVPPYRGRFASTVHVQMLINAREVVLRAVPVRGGDFFEKRLKPKGNRDSVEVVLANMCPSSPQLERRDREEDFGVFYDLSKDYSGRISIPHRDTGRAGGAGGGRGIVHGEASANPACIPGGFAG